MTIEELKAIIAKAGTELDAEKERIKAVQSQQKRRLTDILEQLNKAKTTLRLIEELRETHIGKWLRGNGGFLFCMDVELGNDADEIVLYGLHLQIISPDKLISLDEFSHGDCCPFRLTDTKMFLKKEGIRDIVVTKEIVRAAVEKQLYIAREWYDDFMNLSSEYANRKEMLEQPIEVLGLSPYSLGRIKRWGIVKIKDFIGLPSRIDNYDGIGQKVVADLCQRLEERGLKDFCHAVRFGAKKYEN